MMPKSGSEINKSGRTPGSDRTDDLGEGVAAQNVPAVRHVPETSCTGHTIGHTIGGLQSPISHSTVQSQHSHSTATAQPQHGHSTATA